MTENAVIMVCAPYYGPDAPKSENILEHGFIGSGIALELFASMLALKENVALKIVTLTDDTIAFTNEYHIGFGGTKVSKMPAGANHYWYVYNVFLSATSTVGFWLVYRMIEAIARAYPELCSDEVRDSLGLTEPNPTPR